ncbi:MAG: MvaI/BcnI family restriction endonuclease [Aquabacterium sp.]|nr:MvaI/BcnI family restriction endonuclease [Aquabacterium sp.]
MSMTFQNTAQLLARFMEMGAERVFCKRLAENDNSKQQIYLGGNFEVLSFFPHGEITAFPDLKYPNFKAPLDLYWVDAENTEQAVGAQLILYPAYPEVRLSGFLNGCHTAPTEHLQKIPKEQRRGIDGRVLIFGTTSDKRTLVCLAPANSPLAAEILKKFSESLPNGLFLELTLAVDSDQNKENVLMALRRIHAAGFHESCRRNNKGELIPYKASNGGGYTLEALLGITPNGKSEPDYLGWEIKGHSSNRVTLMTPEPNGGFYGERGAKEFVERYGHEVKEGGMYFTGGHKIGKPCVKTGMTLQVSGFDPLNPSRFDVSGSVNLVDSEGNEAASWAFAQLLMHWNRKHAFAAYVRYTAQKIPIAYRYDTPVLMGEHTNFNKYLNALCSGAIIFDPGTKVMNARTSKSTVKARSQFRINTKDLGLLYQKLTEEKISE